MTTGIMSVIPGWAQRLPVHLQLLMAGFLILHIAGVLGAVWYYFKSNASHPPYKKKLG